MGSAQDVLDVLCAQLGCTRYREKAAGRGAASRLIVTFTRLCRLPLGVLSVQVSMFLVFYLKVSKATLNLIFATARVEATRGAMQGDKLSLCL